MQNDYFFLQKKDVIYSRDYFSTTTNNLIYIRIISSRKNIASFVYGGTKTIGDNFKNGYTALVRIRYPESTVYSFLIKILNENNFGCLPSQSI